MRRRGGNHGAAIALAAKRLGIRAKIFLPEVSSPVKITRIREYGADLVVTAADYGIALAESDRSGARIVVEPGEAVAFCAVLAGKYLPADGERIAVVLSGGNTAAVQFS